MATFQDRRLVASFYLNTEDGKESEAYHVSDVATVIHTPITDPENIVEKDFGDDLQKAIEFAMSQTGWITPDIVVMQAIDGIEKNKGRIQIEYHDMKDTYLAGGYRQYGTKREVEERLKKLTGEILGHEAALSVLYTMKNAYDAD